MNHKRDGKICPIDRGAGTYKVFIRWDGFTPSEDTWEPLENMWKDINTMCVAYFKEKNFRVEEVLHKDQAYHKLVKINNSPIQM